jgi:hypothetical protein
MEKNQAAAAPDRYLVQLLEERVERLVRPTCFWNFNAKKLQCIGRKRRRQVAGQRRQKQKRIERMVRRMSQFGLPTSRGCRWRRLPAPPSQANNDHQQHRQAQRLVQTISRTTLSPFGQIGHRPTEPKQPQNNGRLGPVQGNGG